MTTWKNPEEPPPNRHYDINHLDGQKRLRVLSTQHLNDIIESLKPSNYLTEFVRFMKGCDHLGKKYPIFEELGYITEIRLDFWAKYQYKVKTVIKPAIKKLYKRSIIEDLKRMKMY